VSRSRCRSFDHKVSWHAFGLVPALRPAHATTSAPPQSLAQTVRGPQIAWVSASSRPAAQTAPLKRLFVRQALIVRRSIRLEARAAADVSTAGGVRSARGSPRSSRLGSRWGEGLETIRWFVARELRRSAGGRERLGRSILCLQPTGAAGYTIASQTGSQGWIPLQKRFRPLGKARTGGRRLDLAIKPEPQNGESFR
jgi:hypothetical protein